MTRAGSRWVALLRGVNVGGITVRSADLAQVFAELGFASVRTVLASGNVVFETDAAASISPASIAAATWIRRGTTPSWATGSVTNASPSTRSFPRSRSVTHTETRPPVLASCSRACIVAAKERARPEA